MRREQPRTAGGVLASVLKFPFQILRTVLVVGLMAVARALGGKPRIPKPEPRNLPCEVETDRKR